MDSPRPLHDSRELWTSRDRNGLRAQSEQRGYLLVRQLLPLEKVAAAANVLGAACTRNRLVAGTEPALDWRDPRLLATQSEALSSAPFRALGDCPDLIELAGAILGQSAARRGGDVVRVAFPEAPELATPPHQDAHYLTVPPPVWIAWIPLCDCPIERGPLALIEGSHQGGVRPHRGESLESLRAEVGPDERWTSGPLKAGDVLFLSSLTVHRALENRGAELRLSVDFRFAPLRVTRR